MAPQGNQPRLIWGHPRRLQSRRVGHDRIPNERFAATASPSASGFPAMGLEVPYSGQLIRHRLSFRGRSERLRRASERPTLWEEAEALTARTLILRRGQN